MSKYNDEFDEEMRQRDLQRQEHAARERDRLVPRRDPVPEAVPSVDSDIWDDLKSHDLIGDVAKICKGYGHVYTPGAHKDEEIVDLRINMIEEETQETATGFGMMAEDWVIDPDSKVDVPVVDPVQVADGCIDSIVVHLGALLHLFGEACTRDLWLEVQRSNLAKIGPNGEVIRREDGKVLKGPDWTPPDVEGILRKHGIITESEGP